MHTWKQLANDSDTHEVSGEIILAAGKRISHSRKVYSWFAASGFTVRWSIVKQEDFAL